MKSDEKNKENELDTGEELCKTCGSIMILEEDKYICPHCDAQIDFFGDDEDDDII